jgi:hypothetical protein
MADGTWIRGYNNKSVTNSCSVYPGGDFETTNCGYYALQAYACNSVNAAIYASGYVKAYTYYSYSTRKKKKEIEKFGEADYSSALAFMDKLDLHYYKMKDETDYAKIHVGLIAEETPTTLTAPGHVGVSYTELAIFNTGAIKELKTKVEKLENKSKTISDFGVESISTEKLWVKFSDDFKNELGGGNPVVTVTPSKLGVSMSVSQVNEEGFMVEMEPQNSLVNFNWIAMAKVNAQRSVDTVNENGFNAKFTKMIQSAENDTRPIPMEVKPAADTTNGPKPMTQEEMIKNAAEIKAKADHPAPLGTGNTGIIPKGSERPTPPTLMDDPKAPIKEVSPK